MVKKSFKTKIIIPPFTVVSAFVVCLIILLSIGFFSQRDALIDEKLSANTNSLRLYLETSKANSKAAAVSMAFNPDAVKAVSERNTADILQIFNSVLDLYHINYFTVCDGSGVVLARTHEPGSYGDSVLGQQNVRDALDGKVSTYFEEGTAVKVSVRTGSPMYDAEGNLIGVVSAGVRFDMESAVNELKKLFHSEVTIFIGDVRVATTIIRDGQSITGTKLDPVIADIVLNGKQEYSGDADILGERYITFYMPLLNARGEAFAVFFLGIPKVELMEVSNKLMRNGIILGIVGLLITIVLAYFIISSITEPLIRLSGEMEHIANGNLNINIDVKGDDEVGLLAGSFQKVADTIHKLLDDINVMVTEHENGNTDYTLKASDYQGDYQTLALSVLKFASFGMRDQLTGIANRRSFDNRLSWEWKRAISGRTPISILIIGIDSFKKYNDSYGRRQGDVALQTVVKIANFSVRPSVDFIARRDGDEIILLMPYTDSKNAVSTAEKIHRDIEKALIPSAELGGVKVTVSIGVCTQMPTQGSPVNNFVAMADNALSMAKEKGRNKVIVGG